MSRKARSGKESEAASARESTAFAEQTSWLVRVCEEDSLSLEGGIYHPPKVAFLKIARMLLTHLASDAGYAASDWEVKVNGEGLRPYASLICVDAEVHLCPFPGSLGYYLRKTWFAPTRPGCKTDGPVKVVRHTGPNHWLPWSTLRNGDAAKYLRRLRTLLVEQDPPWHPAMEGTE